MALLGFVLFLARCAGLTNAQSPPLRADLVAWTGESQADRLFSYSVSVFSNAASAETVESTFQLDRRLTALPDHRSPECVGERPVVCTVSVYAEHPASFTITVRVNHGACGLPLTSTIIMRNAHGAFFSDQTAIGLAGRCLLYLPLARR